MRKFIALGATAFSALAITLAPASPAQAIVPIDLGIISGLCGTLPGDVLNLTNSLGLANTAVSTADGLADDAQADLVASTAALVTAVVNHVLAVNTGSDVSVTAPLVGTTVSDYAEKTVAFNAAFEDSVDAQRAANVAGSTQSFASGVSGGLCTILPI